MEYTHRPVVVVSGGLVAETYGPPSVVIDLDNLEYGDNDLLQEELEILRLSLEPSRLRRHLRLLMVEASGRRDYPSA